MGALLFSNQDGIIEKIEMDKLKSLVQKGIEVQLDYRVGDKIQAMKNGTDRIGQVFLLFCCVFDLVYLVFYNFELMNIVSFLICQVIIMTVSEAELEEALSHS